MICYSVVLVVVSVDMFSFTPVDVGGLGQEMAE